MAVTEYTWNPLSDSVLEETDGGGNVVVEYTNQPVLFGPLISECRGAQSRQYHFDGLGNTRLLSDATQLPTESYHSDAWGIEVVATGSKTTSYRWVGRFGYQYDSVIGRHYVRARTYEAASGRWISSDPIAVEQVSHLLTLYTYGENRPSWAVDPSGLLCATYCNKDESENCSTDFQDHHWFPQFGEKKQGQVKVNAICKPPNTIDIDQFTTPLMDSRGNTPHWFMNGQFNGGRVGYNRAVTDIMGKYPNDCCLFLVAMIDLIHRAMEELLKAMESMNKKRLDQGCLPCDKPTCVMHRHLDKTQPVKDTKAELVNKVRTACGSKTLSSLPKGLQESIVARISSKTGCDGLDDPISS